MGKPNVKVNKERNNGRTSLTSVIVRRRASTSSRIATNPTSPPKEPFDRVSSCLVRSIDLETLRFNLLKTRVKFAFINVQCSGDSRRKSEYDIRSVVWAINSRLKRCQLDVIFINAVTYSLELYFINFVFISDNARIPRRSVILKDVRAVLKAIKSSTFCSHCWLSHIVGTFEWVSTLLICALIVNTH